MVVKLTPYNLRRLYDILKHIVAMHPVGYVEQ